jgi:hypothetical protein
MAMSTLIKLWVPKSRLRILAPIPAVKYLKKPKLAAMATAKGAES